MEGSSHCLIFLIFLLSCSTDEVSPAGLTLSPSRSQFFDRESVTLTCEDENISDGWTVRRNTSKGAMKPCGDGWGRSVGSTCSITLFPSDSGVYWCESGSSSISSSSIQLSVSGGSVILQSPVLPVMEGHDVTLSCRAKNQPHNLPAAFYKDGSFIGHETTGNLIINQVKKSDEGHYKCNISGQGESPSSWISVEEKPSAASGPPTTSGPPPSPSPPSLSSSSSPPSLSSSSSSSSQSHLFMLLTPPCLIFGFYSLILVLLIQLLRKSEVTDSVETNDVRYRRKENQNQRVEMMRPLVVNPEGLSPPTSDLHPASLRDEAEGKDAEE